MVLVSPPLSPPSSLLGRIYSNLVEDMSCAMKEEKSQAKEEAEIWTARAEELQAYEEAELKSLAKRAEQFEAERRKSNENCTAGSTLTNTAPSTSTQSEQQASRGPDTGDVMMEDGMGEYTGRNEENIHAHNNAIFSRLEEQAEQLLPGIPNDITFEHICTKLPRTVFQDLSSLNHAWHQAVGCRQLLPGIHNDITFEHICTKLPRTDFQDLSSLNHAWDQAVGCRRFYDARVRSHSAETLVLHDHDKYGGRNTAKVAVYSVRDRRCEEFPPIPQLTSGVPSDCQCVSLNGKIYILGGENEDSHDGRKEVYVFDVASQRQHWQQCASMQSGRYRFGCSVLDEKIFVFGGLGTNEPDEGPLTVHGCEVYDPRINAWFPITPPQFWRVDHHVATIGGELVLFGGYNEHNREAPPVEVYCPTTDEWRVVDPLCDRFRYLEEGVFTVEGKFYLLTQLGIYVHDTDKNSWEQLHSNAFPEIGPNELFRVDPCSTVVVHEDELVVGVHWNSTFPNPYELGSCLLQSKGFRGRTKEIVWEIVPDCEGAFGFFTCPLVL